MNELNSNNFLNLALSIKLSMLIWSKWLNNHVDMFWMVWDSLFLLSSHFRARITYLRPFPDSFNPFSQGCCGATRTHYIQTRELRDWAVCCCRQYRTQLLWFRPGTQGAQLSWFVTVLNLARRILHEHWFQRQAVWCCSFAFDHCFACCSHIATSCYLSDVEQFQLAFVVRLLTSVWLQYWRPYMKTPSKIVDADS